MEGVSKEILGMKLEAQFGEEEFRLSVNRVSRERRNKEFNVIVESAEGERSYQVELLGRHRDRWTLKVGQFIEDFIVYRSDGKTLVDWGNRVFPIRISSPKERSPAQIGLHQSDEEIVVRAQMPGKIIQVVKSAGDDVREGEAVVIVEAMKMQNEMNAPRSGTLLSCDLKEGESVGAGDELFRIG